MSVFVNVSVRTPEQLCEHFRLDIPRSILTKLGIQLINIRTSRNMCVYFQAELEPVNHKLNCILIVGLKNTVNDEGMHTLCCALV